MKSNTQTSQGLIGINVFQAKDNGEFWSKPQNLEPKSVPHLHQNYTKPLPVLTT